MTLPWLLVIVLSASVMLLLVVACELNRLLKRAWEREEWYHDALTKALLRADVAVLPRSYAAPTVGAQRH